MKNLKMNWLVISKLMWEIWQILTQALGSLKNCHFNEFLLSKVYIVWAKQVQRKYLSWNWRVIQTLRYLTCRFKIDMMNFTNFDPNTWKSLHFNELVLIKVFKVWAKIVQRSYLSRRWKVIQSLRKNWLVVRKMTKGIW